VFERFTDRSRRVLVLAQEEARLLSHPFIGPEHVLLGLVGEERGGAARALGSAGITLGPARDVISRLAGTGGGGPDSPPFTPSAKKALERALREALARGDHEIDTEHLLLGVVTPPEGIVASVLAEFATSGEDMRHRVENILAGSEPADDGPVERYFEYLSARDWPALGEVMGADVVRVGPLGDEVVGRTEYLDLLARSVPEHYGNDVRRIVYTPDKRSAFARVTEHLAYPDQELHLEEAYVFVFDEARVITRVEVFWQSPS
jgi:ATP-dependent Clp protease ATP-binding subunit ClpA